MDEETRRRLKRGAKAEIERRSRALEEKLDAAIPVSTEDPSWADRYRREITRDRAARAARAAAERGVASLDEITPAFVVVDEGPADPESSVESQRWLLCWACRTVIAPVVWKELRCRCGALGSRPKPRHREAIELVGTGHVARLVARGD